MVVELISGGNSAIPLPLVVMCPLGPIHVIAVGRLVAFSALVAEQTSWYASPVVATPCARTSTTIARHERVLQ